ncbi:MAG: hypothetical protein H7Z74_07715 [Anaerolineae bacterium]|nr:hypothetical protein [Gemmatimonadaceae bacterium]
MSLDSVRVQAVERWDKQTDDRHRNSVAAGLGQIIVIHVKGLNDLVDIANCRTEDGTLVENCREQQIALFLDGREMKGLQPESGAPEVGNTDSGTVRFHLQRTPETDEVWADLLGEPRMGRKFFHRSTDVSVGLAGSYALPTQVRSIKGLDSPFHLIRIHPWRFIMGSALFALFVIYCYRLASMTNLLRESGDSKSAANTAGQDPRRLLKPYSLGRWQMAIWFVLVIGAFVFIWIVTGASDTITPTVLALLGIGAGTALGAAALDTRETNAASAKLVTRLREKADISQRISTLEATAGWDTDPGKVSEWASLTSLRDKADADIDKLKAVLQPPRSRGWWNDIIRDEDGGHSFHRFQVFVWTIVLVFLFVYSVWSRLSMPEFSATLLAIMGISGGTYLGFKFPESQS